MSEIQSLIAAVKAKAESLAELIAGNLPHTSTLTELADAAHTALADLENRVAAIETAAKGDLASIEQALADRLTALVDGKIDTFAQGVTSTLQSHMSQIQQAVTLADSAKSAVDALKAGTQA
ncbi:MULTISPECIES: hypothetical protein [unclassified Burkholderia]|uniref:hypothetical protein n=1 Tax=unclassified Burkholderia TaxID=2613784 RepID=UPI000F5A9E0D|nr:MULTISPECIES: hypothetical protein [unclassified Burkholderia]RQS17484.1 hypothetical protein DIE05_37355 [Burkholderia sp. Bp8995]RQS37891.1 hypothetical protein DIE00_37230 [Burkholderia sp. Bp8989]